MNIVNLKSTAQDKKRRNAILQSSRKCVECKHWDLVFEVKDEALWRSRNRRSQFRFSTLSNIRIMLWRETWKHFFHNFPRSDRGFFLVHWLACGNHFVLQGGEEKLGWMTFPIWVAVTVGIQ